MRRVFISILLAAGATGCVAAEGDESFVIVNNLVPDVDEMTGTVSFTPSETGPFLSRGVFGFFATPFVGSQFESRVQAAAGRESLRTIFVEGANISLEIGQILIEDLAEGTLETRGTASQFEFQTGFTSALPPNGGLSVGIYDIVPVDVMTDLRAAVIDVMDNPNLRVSAEITTTTTAFGDFYGERIDATSFQFPVTILKESTCRDLVCSPSAGETTANCPFDCSCGDEICNPFDEDATSCPLDCT